MKIPVLSYHSISNENSPLSLSVEQFEKQLFFLKKNNFKSIFFNEVNSSEKKKIIITFDDGYKDLIINCLPLLKKYGFKCICYIVTNNIGKTNIWDFNNKSINKKELMSKKDLNEWINQGMIIGSHTSDHLDLTKLSIKATQNQIVNSKNLLEDNFGIGVDSFCYPYGKYNLQVLQIVKNSYKNAVTTNRSRYCYSKHNPYLIPRIDMGKKLSKFKMFMKLNTFYEDIKF